MTTQLRAKADASPTKYFNDSCEVNDAAQEFIDDVCSELEKGYSFLPFVGAGFSVPSGAPVVPDLASYLNWCIAMAIGVADPGVRPWNPRTDRWPSFDDPKRYIPEGWAARVMGTITQCHANMDAASRVILQQAYGAMAEWRMALLFLSRLALEERGEGRQRTYEVALDSPRQEVIDACLLEIMRGREPALCHNMLGLLANAMRIDVLLTTNFDDLLERAFANARNPLTVLDIHLNSDLPPISSLTGTRALIKLHGTRHSMRADFSLDALPPNEDRDRFVGYLARQGAIHPDESGKIVAPFFRHVILIGFSGKERRTRALIQHAWSNLSPDFCVYWICHSDEDVNTAHIVTREFAEAQPKDQVKARTTPYSKILRHTDAGLLLLQLYQSLRNGLPSRSIPYPSTTRLSFPPSPQRIALQAVKQAGAGRDSTTVETVNRSARAEFFRLTRVIEKRIDQMRRVGFSGPKVIAVTSEDGVSGVTSVCAEVFRRCVDDKKNVCIWIDMNDSSSTEDCFDQLLDAAHFRLGHDKWLPPNVAKEPTMWASEIRRLATSTDKAWTVFINAREVPGANFDADAIGHGWLDHERRAQKSRRSTRAPAIPLL